MYFYYSLLALPLAVIGFPLFIYLPTFYATDLGVNIALVGVVLFFARIIDVITDPLIGSLSDKSLKKFSSRKPIMIVGFFILSLSFYFLINPFHEWILFSLSFFSIATYVGWSMIIIPYISWSSELSENYYEKSKLNASREMFTILGLVLSLLIPFIIPSVDLSDKLNKLFIFFMYLLIPTFLITMFTIRPVYHKVFRQNPLKSFKKFYKENKDIKYLQIGYFLNNLANAIPATLFLIFVQSVLNSQDSAEWILIVYFLAGFISLPLWTLLSKYRAKKTIWRYSIILACSTFSFVIFLQEGDIYQFAIISFLSGISLGADIAFPTAIYSDVVQRQKKNITGFLFGIWTMITKLSLAVAILITFGILGLCGFNQDSLRAYDIILVVFLYGVLPIIIKLIALFYITKFQER